MARIAPNKIVFTAEQHEFLRSNYATMTNPQLAEALGLKLTRVRNELFSLGLKRMELEYWTPEQVEFLKDNFHSVGCKEIADIFNDIWPKNKPWTKKHIEKKRIYLGLSRTKEQRDAIRERNRARGVFQVGNVKMWETRGANPDGTVVLWAKGASKIPFIKVNGKYIHLNVHVWEQHFGKVPKGMNVYRIDGNPLNNAIENLELITNAELATRNSKKGAMYPEEVRELQKLINKLNRKINGKKQNGRLA